MSSFSRKDLATQLPHSAEVLLGGGWVAAAPLQGVDSPHCLHPATLLWFYNAHWDAWSIAFSPHPFSDCEPIVSGFYLKFVMERTPDGELGDLGLL